ncbi:aldo/keto reductase [Micromonospora radicis]|uniref:Aldo/keto reductase n=1 Tax=Micromonospora radicis TaxID=1894971 RepID=A0A418MTD1_9ACTN|nr:aldo/keto reductase [Micromonospora radicis]RIV37543.1 aldo/keto reductase [Micromonospora radicis]
MTGVRLGRSAATVSRLGLGCAQLGNLWAAIDDAEATDTVRAAWECGVRYFDTAPHYGLGLSERRLGAALRTLPREAYAISTKVGRRLVPVRSGSHRRDPEGFHVPADHRRVWDFSADGTHRCLESSLDRLGVDRVDLVLIHDPEDHQAQALAQAYPALHELRAQGVVGAIGVGSKHWPVLHRFVTDTDIDAIMIAGRYTLLEQPALDELLPDCQRRGVSVLNAGVFNSGLLAVPRPHAGLRYEYAHVPQSVLARVHAIVEVCARHDTSLPAAALAFAAAHPAVAAVVVGADHPEQVRRNAALLTATPPPPQFWAELVAEGLLRADAPLPAAIVGDGSR